MGKQREMLPASAKNTLLNHEFLRRCSGEILQTQQAACKPLWVFGSFGLCVYNGFGNPFTVFQANSCFWTSETYGVIFLFGSTWNEMKWTGHGHLNSATYVQPRSVLQRR